MNAKVETERSAQDTIKLISSLLLVVGGVVAFYYFEERSLLLRVIALLVVMGVSVAIALMTGVGRGVLRFAQDARTEVRKVVWPTRAETIQTTMVVFLMVIMMGIILWLLDMFLLWAVKFLTGQGG